jgi:hypothetical protein
VLIDQELKALRHFRAKRYRLFTHRDLARSAQQSSYPPLQLVGVASQCTGAFVLAEAGLLDGPSAVECMSNTGVRQRRLSKTKGSQHTYQGEEATE